MSSFNWFICVTQAASIRLCSKVHSLIHTKKYSCSTSHTHSESGIRIEFGAEMVENGTIIGYHHNHTPKLLPIHTPYTPTPPAKIVWIPTLSLYTCITYPQHHDENATNLKTSFTTKNVNWTKELVSMEWLCIILWPISLSSSSVEFWY